MSAKGGLYVHTEHTRILLGNNERQSKATWQDVEWGKECGGSCNFRKKNMVSACPQHPAPLVSTEITHPPTRNHSPFNKLVYRMRDSTHPEQAKKLVRSTHTPRQLTHVV